MMSPAALSARTSDPSITFHEFEIVVLPKLCHPVVVFPSKRSRHPFACSLEDRTFGVTARSSSDLFEAHATATTLTDATVTTDVMTRWVRFISLPCHACDAQAFSP